VTSSCMVAMKVAVSPPTLAMAAESDAVQNDTCLDSGGGFCFFAVEMVSSSSLPES
jgi:hypothetical protein